MICDKCKKFSLTGETLNLISGHKVGSLPIRGDGMHETVIYRNFIPFSVFVCTECVHEQIENEKKEALKLILYSALMTCVCTAVVFFLIKATEGLKDLGEFLFILAFAGVIFIFRGCVELYILFHPKKRTLDFNVRLYKKLIVEVMSRDTKNDVFWTPENYKKLLSDSTKF